MRERGEERGREEGGKVRQRDISTQAQRERKRKREKEKKKREREKRGEEERILARLQRCKLLPLLSSLVGSAASG